ncbi:MAG: DUF924 family protein [Proteobacteria bacterium]|nr:DUF924 family protein [Burkholderiales bacterium]
MAIPAVTTSRTPHEVVEFWRDAGPSKWFRRDAAFDARFHEGFVDAHFSAARRALDDWNSEAQGALALLILLDQFPRNAFRHSAHMFATDSLARYFAQRALAAGHDQKIEPALRLFCYLPFMHSESVDDQELSLRLHRTLGEASTKHALEHSEIVRRFGRFPHRNRALGRESTADEEAFLQGGGFRG